MNEILGGLAQALHLIVTLDAEVMEITALTLQIALLSTTIATVLSVPLGGLIHFREFRGKRVVVNIIQTLYALPTVIAGLLVYLLISRAGPFGPLHLLFTPAGMVIAQVVLIMPIMTGLTITALSGIDRTTRDTIVALGASEGQAILTMLREARYALMGAVVLGFGRAISEVGAAMMIGGNIRGYTRVLTTSIALETSMGNISLSLALGIILLAIALVVNVLLNLFQQQRVTYD